MTVGASRHMGSDEYSWLASAYDGTRYAYFLFVTFDSIYPASANAYRLDGFTVQLVMLLQVQLGFVSVNFKNSEFTKYFSC